MSSHLKDYIFLRLVSSWYSPPYFDFIR
jgi:hypothetical protein